VVEEVEHLVGLPEVVVMVVEALVLRLHLLELLERKIRAVAVEEVLMMDQIIMLAVTAAPVWSSSKCQIPSLQPSQVV
jgi:hypothetical protein